jgi:hypothetical protein
LSAICLALLSIVLSSSLALGLDQSIGHGGRVAPEAFGVADFTEAQPFEPVPSLQSDRPLDAQGVAGPNHLMVAQSTQVRVLSKNGELLALRSLTGWWREGIDAERVSDPKLAYDSVHGRWIFLALENGRDALLAVSADANPLGAWRMWRFLGDPSGAVNLDAPGLGLNEKWIAFTARLTNPQSKETTPDQSSAALWVVDKSSAYAGAYAPAATRFCEPNFAGVLVPAWTEDEKALPLVSASQPGQLTLYALSGDLADPVWRQGPNVRVESWAKTFPKAPQRNSEVRLDVGDARIGNAVLRDGVLWCAQSVPLPRVKPTHVAVRWHKIDPASGTLLQSGVVDEHASAKRFYFSPTIAVNAGGQALLGFVGSSRTSFLGAYFARVADSSPTLFKAGEAVSASPGVSGSTCVDPADALTFRTLQEYAAASQTRSAQWGVVAPPLKPNVAVFWRNQVNGRNSVELYNGLTRLGATALPRVVNTTWRLAAVGPYDAGNLGRLFWRNPVTGKNSLQSLQGVAQLQYAPLRDVGNSNWRLAGAADFDGNGALSLLWRNEHDGRTALERLDENGRHLAYQMLEQPAAKEWRPVALADLNADGSSDILWRNTLDGRNLVWFMRGAKFLDSAALTPVEDQNWTLAASADFNADAKPDLLWRNLATGQTVVWLMDGCTLFGHHPLAQTPSLDWRPVGAADLR